MRLSSVKAKLNGVVKFMDCRCAHDAHMGLVFTKLNILKIVVDADVPSRLARFWEQALTDYRIRAYDDAEIARLAALGLTPETDPSVILDGPGPELCFQKMEGTASGAKPHPFRHRGGRPARRG